MKEWLLICNNVYGGITDFEVCGLTETQKSKYLEIETLCFLQIKKFIHYTFRAINIKQK